jgi:hypothetical protein
LLFWNKRKKARKKEKGKNGFLAGELAAAAGPSPRISSAVVCYKKLFLGLVFEHNVHPMYWQYLVGKKRNQDYPILATTNLKYFFWNCGT